MRVLSVLFVVGCGGTTGNGLVSFATRAGGPVEAHPGLEFDTGLGYHLTLIRAKLHIGAVYLNRSRPSSGGPEAPCSLPGIYVGQAFGGEKGIDLDLLSPMLQPFAIAGEGTADLALTAEVWLSGGDVHALEDPTPIFDVAGNASQGGQSWPFSATVTIGANRKISTVSAATPGTNPICRQRIVSPILVDFALSNRGTLDLRIDPRGMFHGLDFAQSPPGELIIPDQAGGIGGALLKGVSANSGVYQFTFSGE